MLFATTDPAPESSKRTMRQRAQDLSLRQLLAGSVILNLALGGAEQFVFRAEGGVRYLAVLPAWFILVGLVAFLRDDDALEAAVLVGGATAAGVFVKLGLAWLALRLQGATTADTNMSLVFAWMLMPLFSAIGAAIPAGIIVGIVRAFQPKPKARGARSA